MFARSLLTTKYTKGEKMKKITAMVILLIILSISTSFGAILRVNNNAGTSPDFVTIQAAHNGAAFGDTLYVEGSSNSYGNAVFTKKLAIFGPGYFLVENENTQANTLPASLGTITVNSGSQGSEFSGLTINIITINTDEIILRRNYIVSTTNYTTTVTVTNAQNVLITQNYIYCFPNHNTTYNALIIQGSSFVTVQNNYIRGRYTSIDVSTSGLIVFKNNVIHDGFSGSGNQLINNILYMGTYTGRNEVLNNVCNANQFGNEDGNQSNIPMATVFTETGSSDGMWQLAFNSPAQGAGFDGEDCGMFGGSTPYVLSGLPNIPAIYQFVAPTVVAPSSDLPVHIRAKSHSEE